MARPALATLPLPGGSPGASVVLHPLRCGSLAMPEGWVHREPGLLGTLRGLGVAVPEEQRRRAPLVAYLIEHPTAGAIVIDTAFGAGVRTDRRRALGTFNALVFRGIELAPGETVVEQLAARGVGPGDVAAVLMTHLHADHTGGLRDLPGATVLVDEAEWAAAHARDAPVAGYQPADLDAVPLDWRLLPAAPAPLPGDLSRLEHAIDVLGDGSIRLVPTPGHSRGHRSVLVRLRDGPALLAGDAIYTLANLHEGRRPFKIVDGRAYEASVAFLAAFAAEHPDAPLVPGHDMVAWTALAPRYA